MAQLSVPIYQGGAEYSASPPGAAERAADAKQVDDARRTAVQNAVQAWETLVARTGVGGQHSRGDPRQRVALEGVEREAIVGSRTTLDVLNAQQALLNSQTTLVQNLAQLVTASYHVASAIGRLTARDLHLPVPLYDETAYYNAVKNKWAGPATTPPTSRRAEQDGHDAAGRLRRRRAAELLGADPSMEDILASIRRILARTRLRRLTATRPALAPPAARACLQLDPVDDGAAESAAPELRLPESACAETPAAAEPPPRAAVPASLVAPEAAAAAASSVGSLVRTLTPSARRRCTVGGPTIEDIVREEIRPLLKEWLDTNLPPMVERLVRAEIERVVGRAVP